MRISFLVYIFSITGAFVINLFTISLASIGVLKFLPLNIISDCATVLRGFSLNMRISCINVCVLTRFVGFIRKENKGFAVLTVTLVRGALNIFFVGIKEAILTDC